VTLSIVTSGVPDHSPDDAEASVVRMASWARLMLEQPRRRFSDHAEVRSDAGVAAGLRGGYGGRVVVAD
jgi:hypothetical protein